MVTFRRGNVLQVFLKQFINGNVAARILQCCVENPLMYSHNKVESLKVVFCNVDKNRRQNSACVINITLMIKKYLIIFRCTIYIRDYAFEKQLFRTLFSNRPYLIQLNV